MLSKGVGTPGRRGGWSERSIQKYRKGNCCRAARGGIAQVRKSRKLEVNVSGKIGRASRRRTHTAEQGKASRGKEKVRKVVEPGRKILDKLLPSGGNLWGRTMRKGGEVLKLLYRTLHEQHRRSI